MNAPVVSWSARDQVIFGIGLLAGVGLTLFAVDAIVQMRRARAQMFRARAELLERELVYLQRVEQLAAGNAAAAA